MQYDETCLEYFLAHQEQLLPEPVAETMEEAEEFLEDHGGRLYESERGKSLFRRSGG